MKLGPSTGGWSNWVSGSYARQEADVASDIDLVVVSGNKFDPADAFCIVEELHCTLEKAVDIPVSAGLEMPVIQ